MSGPDVIMFIRHGEKPGVDAAPYGIDHDGQHDRHSLSVRGWTRAGALASLLSNAPAASHPQLVTPQRILATKWSKDYLSRREVRTATPLARRLGIPVDSDFDHQQVKELGASIQGDARPTLVVWHHGSLPEVLAMFPISNRASVPAQWPDDRFDLVWVLTREAGGTDYMFSAVDQSLLDGDADASSRRRSS